MEKTYASLYIQNKPSTKKKIKRTVFNVFKRGISRAVKLSKSTPKYFNGSSAAEYFSNRCKSDFAAKYAVSGFIDLLSSGKILNKTKRNNLLEILSPILPDIAYNIGLSRVSELENRFSAGIEGINISEFLDIIYMSINSKNQDKSFTYSGYGDEIPIDVVESCSYTYSQNIAQHKIQGILDNNPLVSDLKFVRINFIGHIKNTSGELVKSNSYMQKLGESMNKKQFVTLRIGKDVYENCLIENLEPVITNIYELNLVMTLMYNYRGNNIKKSVFGGTVLNPSSSANISYYLSQENYAGIFS